MTFIINWAAFIIVVIALYIADLNHLAASQYNSFILLLLGLVVGLVMVIKWTHERDRATE